MNDLPEAVAEESLMDESTHPSIIRTNDASPEEEEAEAATVLRV